MPRQQTTGIGKTDDALFLVKGQVRVRSLSAEIRRALPLIWDNVTRLYLPSIQGH